MTTPRVNGKTVAVAGATLHYMTVTASDDACNETTTKRPCVLFVHGAAFSALSWFQSVPALLTNLSPPPLVICMSIRGWGMSNLHEIEKSVDPLAFGQDVCAILDAETVDRAILVCQSLGGTHGVRFAYEFPDRVDCVVMSNTFAGLTDGTKTDSDAECDGDILHRYGQALASRSHGDVGLELRNEELEKFMKLLHHPITHIEGKRLPVPDRAKRAKRQADSKPELAMLSAMMTQSNINLPSSAAPARMMAEAAVELKDFRGKYQGPVHFIATLSDPVMMWEILAYSAAKLKALGGSVTFQILEGDDTGHCPFYTDSSTYNAHLLSFLKTQYKL